MTFDVFCRANHVDALERRELLLYLAFLRFRAATDKRSGLKIVSSPEAQEG